MSQAAGTAEGNQDTEDTSAEGLPDQAQGPQQAQQGMQEGPQAPPQASLHFQTVSDLQQYLLHTGVICGHVLWAYWCNRQHGPMLR